MPKESRAAKKARKAAAKEAARELAARITAGEVPEFLRHPRSSAGRRPLKPQHKVVQAVPQPTARALIPPSSAPLRSRDREQYADNAPPAWVKETRYAKDD
ncbi:hypothetical protein GCM10010207_84430 [Streptomyces atratus]|nr:hypothetical protein GCM10010207_84430 [Streptomyces atratus]